ncbi:MAG: ATP-binding cassette domain-containing protein [Candidatus Pacebacteria bacterium]|nr:ATP-binding cassette domain-containing protein [Candidatus Paceibacterota bacterium]
MAILETKNLTKKFGGIHALDSLSIVFEAGKITGVIGPNGSGKSTLVNVLTGMLPMSGGEVIVADASRLKKILPHDMPSFGITRTFQEVRLFEQMTVLDNILVVVTKRNVIGALFEKHKEYHLKIAERVLERVGLVSKKHELAVNLSYGQRKLLEIARVLAMTESESTAAEIFFFDEPFAGLFPEMVKLVVSVMQDLRQKGKTLVLIEHNMELIRELSDKVIVMDSGALLAEGLPEHVLARRDVIEAYLGE